MASKSGTSKTPTGRKTPQSFSHIRPPSPKVDLNVSKSKSAPSPKPKSEYLRSKGKSPSNHHERSFNNGHNNTADDCEYSVRSAFDPNQLAKIKVVVEKTRLNVIDAAVDDRNHFHAVPNNHKYDPNNDLSLSYGEFAGEYIEPTPRPMVTTSNDDCGVSDITADAPYMTQLAKYNNTFANSVLLEADDLASLSMDALDNMAKMINEERAKRSRLQGTPVVSAAATPVVDAQASKSSNDLHNIPVPEAVMARKFVGRARSGGNEQMIRKSRNSPSVQNNVYVPSFRSFRQSIDEFGDVPLGSVDLVDVTPSKSVDGVDGEVERALRGLLLNGTSQPIQSVTPTTMPTGNNGAGIATSTSTSSSSVHHSHSASATATGGGATSSSSSSALPTTLSPAGVNSHPLSRGASVSGRGSGTYVGIDRMYHDSSTFASPLHYVESPTHTAGNVVPSSTTNHSSSRPAPRINNLMDPLEPTPSITPSSAHKHAKKLESFREAKQYSDSQIDVALVEEFQPVGVAQKEKTHGGNTLTTPPVRPIMTRTVSTGSDLSQEGQLDSKTVAAMKEFNTLLQRDAAESNNNNINRRNRDLLVSPLCAFDDCASMESGWSFKSGGSRRSQTSHNKHKTGHAKDKGHASSHSHKNVSHVNYTSATSSYLAKQINR